MSLEITYLADQPHHIEELARLHQADWGHLFPRTPLDQRIARLKKAAGRREIPTVVIAVDGSALVGSAALVQQDMDDRPDLSPWLAAVYVKSDRRRSGIASKLLSRVDQEALELGVEKLYLFTEFQEKFYSKRGWELLERVDYHGTPVSVMAKQLQAVSPDDRARLDGSMRGICRPFKATRSI